MFDGNGRGDIDDFFRDVLGSKLCIRTFMFNCVFVVVQVADLFVYVGR